MANQNVGHDTGINLAERHVLLTVPSAKAAEGELEVIKRALYAPPSRASLTTTVTSVFSSLVVCADVLSVGKSKDGTFSLDGFHLAVLVGAAVVAALAIVSFIQDRCRSQPLHDLAKSYVDSLVSKKEQGPEQGINPPPASGSVRSADTSRGEGTSR